VLAGSLLSASQFLLEKGIHPNAIADGFLLSLKKSLEIIDKVSKPISLENKAEIQENVDTALSSKAVSQISDTFGPIAVDAVLKISDFTNHNADLKEIRVVKKIGGTVEDTELVEGVVLTDSFPVHIADGPTEMKDCKIGVVQFHISAPKTEMEMTVVVNDNATMDRLIKEERRYLLQLVKKIADTGVNVLLIQKSILRDACSDMALHFLAKKNILVIKDIEREDIPFLCASLNAKPIAHIDQFTPDKFGKADLVREITLGNDTRVTKILGIPNKRCNTILIRGSSKLILDEAERSMHDALCVVRSLVKKPSILPGGGAIEIELSQKLFEFMRTGDLTGVQKLVIEAYAQALETIPYTLAENAGFGPLEIVSKLKAAHVKGNSSFGLDIKKGEMCNMWESKVLQPSLVTISALSLAVEFVRVIMKIDDLVMAG
jgi:T-complex protein 1 subunit delta